MPSQRNVSWAQLKVGVMSIAAFILLGILVFLITGSSTFFQEETVLYTYLSDSAALAPGANVRLNGIYIGSIGSVNLTNESNPRRTVRVAMDVQRDMLGLIPVDSEASIASENVLGNKYINIRRGMSATSVQAGATIEALDTTDFDDVVIQGYSVLASAQEMLERIDGIVSVVERGEGSIGKFLTDPALYDNLNGTVAEARQITAALNEGQGTLGRLFYDESIYEEAQGTLSRLNRTLDGIEQGQGTAGKLLKDDALYDELRATVIETRALMSDLNAGKGTAGKLLKDDEFHNQLTATVAQLDMLLNRINTGEGTLGQLVVNPQMYESLNGATRELDGFLKEFRANPRKFLTVNLDLF
jgi:phospholipid/cholesterol/gamma-HCH transport system substrate-binding protein